jgi:site-specific recombinase XerD
MYLTAFHAFLRVGEFTSRSAATQGETLQLADISFPDTSGLLISLRYFKGNISRSPFKILIPPSSSAAYCPVSAMRLFLFARGPASGPLFVSSDGSPVLRTQFSARLAASLASLGLSHANLKPHSFRIGAATSACAEGVCDSVIQRLGRWKSDAYKRYIRIPCFVSH